VNKTLIGVLIASATTLSSAAFAQPGPDPSWTPPPPAAQEPPPPPQAQAYPTPAYAAPAPATTIVAGAPAGQWVYTNQYGWVWMPYGESYTYVAGPGAAYSYAYYPHFGWRWVAAPWVLGVGPRPFWGHLGPSHYAWYGHPGYRGGVIARGGWRGAPVYRAAPSVAWHGGARSYGRSGHRR
jgi:hypothetical protein